MSSKPSYPAEDPDSRILRGYCGARRFMTRPTSRKYLGPVPRSVIAEDEWQKTEWPRDAAEDDPVLGIPRLQGEGRHSSKAASKAPPEDKVSRMEPTWGYGVGVVQGKDVTSVLNAPTNVLAILMGKDP